jgi:hypothetical protein
MAVNLVNSNDITVTQTGNNIELQIDSDVKTQINQNTSNITDAQQDILDITGQILWTNSNPNNAFSSQTILLNSENYDILEIFFKNAYDNNNIYSLKTLKGCDIVLQCNHVSSSNTIYHRYRKMTYASDTSYTFSTGTQQLTSSSSIENSDLYIIPLYIIGYKTGILD